MWVESVPLLRQWYHYLLRIQIQITPSIMVPLRARLFRFTTEEGIDTKDFAEKTGMAIMSVNSMIRYAKGNAKLYEEMLAAGYTDGEFPSWWFSPARVAELRQDPAQRTLTDAEVAEGAEDRIDVDKAEGAEGAEGYDPTPPRIPTPREAESGRPALKSASVPTAASVPSAPSHAQPAIPAQPSQPMPHSAMLSQRQPPSAMLS
jgi:hypothetical protein